MQPRFWIAALVLAAGVSVARADGKAFGYRDFTTLQPVTQHEQVAAIHLHDGIQRMLIAVNVDLEEDQHGLWIFPVPGRPETTQVDLVTEFPVLRGRDPFGAAREGLSNLGLATRASQVYTVLCCLPGLSMTRGGIAQEHVTIEKWGLRAATVSADSVDALATYVQQQHPAVTPADLASFEPYCNADYVLVVAWVTSHAKLREEFGAAAAESGPGHWPTLFVQFPTAEAFYPMRPTGSYGDAPMRVRLYITGFVRPQTAPAFEQLLDIGHFVASELSDKLPVEFLEGLPREHIHYTRVEAHTFARDFVDDLRFVPTRLPGLTYAEFIERATTLPWVSVSWLLVMAVLSYVSAGSAGLVVWRSWHRPALLGLTNCATLIVLLAFVQYAKVEWLTHGRTPHIMKRPREVFVLVFSLLFVVATYGLEMLLSWPLRT